MQEKRTQLIDNVKSALLALQHLRWGNGVLFAVKNFEELRRKWPEIPTPWSPPDTA